MSDLPFLLLGEDIAEFALGFVPLHYSTDYYSDIATALCDFASKVARASGHKEDARRAAEMAEQAFRWRLSQVGHGQNLTLAQIVGTEVAPVAGGEALFVTFQIMDGPRCGEKLRHSIDTLNRCRKIEEIGNCKLLELLAATKTPPPLDSDNLHLKPLLIFLDGDGIKKFVAIDTVMKQ